MRDTLFLFGAGASFGAGGIIPERPPLGSRLYSELERIYPGTWGGLPHETKSKFRENFELGMQEVYERWGIAIPQLMREMAIYFIQFRPISEECLYRVLIRTLRKAGLERRTIFSTLNYECVLEFAIVSENGGISYFEENPSEAIPVWKLHGSSNFFSEGITASPGITYSTGVSFEAGLRALGSIEEVIHHCLVETALAPAMSLYMRGKPVAISPQTLATLQTWWAQAVYAAKNIVVIGVHPNAEDVHLWTALASTNANLFFVGDTEAVESWRKQYRSGPTKVIGTRFSSAISDIVSHLL